MDVLNVVGVPGSPSSQSRPNGDLALPPRPRRSVGFAVGCLVVTTVFWGMSFPFTKTLNLQVDQFFGVHADASSWALRLSSAGWLMFCRFALALVIFSMLFRRLVAGATRAEWIAGSMIGISFSAGLILQIVGMASISASRSGFLTSLVAVFTPLITAIALRLWPRPQVILGVGVALLGVAVLTGLLGPSSAMPSSGSPQPSVGGSWTWGDSLTTWGAVLFAIQICLVDHYGRRLNAAALTPGMLASTAACGLVLFLATAWWMPEQGPGGWLMLTAQTGFWLPVLALSLLSTVLAFHLMNSYQHYVTAPQAGVIYTMEPVFASLSAMVLPGWLSQLTGLDYANEQLVAAMVIGGGLIIAANLISLWPLRR